MTSTAQDARAKALDRYVALDALESFIRKVHDFAAFDALAAVDGDNDFVLADLLEIHMSLWPDDPEEGPGEMHPEIPEAQLASARGTLLEARLLTLLATDDGREWMLDEALRLQDAAGRQVEQATPKLSDG
jgi:hypothetical protein